VYWCRTCRHRWFPCKPHCRGYVLVMVTAIGPEIRGCPECGVPSSIARAWPEAYRAMARELDAVKQRALAVEG
jgi:hypothetical protein